MNSGRMAHRYSAMVRASSGVWTMKVSAEPPVPVAGLKTMGKTGRSRTSSGLVTRT
jgi:hypothetical protein